MKVHHQDEHCKQMFARLSEYLDMELPPAICKEIDSHFESCPPCIEFLDTFRKSIELCREYSPSERPAPLTDAARDELRAGYRKMLDAQQANRR